MANLQEMLKSANVEWKKLGEVCSIQRGRVISKKYLEAHKGTYPVYSSQTKNSGEIGVIDTYDFDGEYATWTTDGAYAGTVFYRNGKFSITNICGLISCKNKDQLLVKFIVYWLQIEAKKHVTDGSGNHKLMSNVVAEILIPIPHIEVQSEIVRILDAFTELSDMLATELTLRKKQYAYYLEKLLSEEGLKKCAEILKEEGALCWTRIGEVCNFQRGRVISKIYLGAHKGAYPVYSSQTKNSGAIGAIDTYDFDGEYATWTTDGAYAGTVFYRNGKFSITNICGLISCKNEDQLLVKFVVYWLQIEAKKHVTYGSGNHKLMIHAMSDVPIPIPPLKVQSYVVGILDKFSALIEETEGALPTEIEMRKKQYEYYRDALLKFEK